MTTEKKRLLKVRKQISKRRPAFEAFESWRFKKVKPRWRRPRGIDNKMRTNEKGWPRSANIGWGGPSLVRGLHPSGLKEVIVFNVDDVKILDVNEQVARIGRTVGRKKRELILEEANKLGIKVLNPGEKQSESSDFEELEDEKK